MDYQAGVVTAAVEALSALPGIGRKTALRLVLYLLKEKPNAPERLAAAVQALAQAAQCPTCGNVSDGGLCVVCASPRRSNAVICVVEDLRDLMALERTGQFQGRYHVLGGLINPMAGVGPDSLNLQPLLTRAAQPEVQEVILAMAGNLEGETTAFYVARQLAALQGRPVALRITNLARGLPVGTELEYADDLTLARSLALRSDYTTQSSDA